MIRYVCSRTAWDDDGLEDEDDDGLLEVAEEVTESSKPAPQAPQPAEQDLLGGMQ